MRLTITMVTGWMLGTTAAWAGGFATNEDFVVRTASENGQLADRSFALKVAQQALEYKQAIAREWLGTQIPNGVGRTYLTVMLTDRDENGRTWAQNRLTGEYHNVHLRTTREGALGGTLAHEVAHIVLSTRFQAEDSLPPWAAEGIASRYDGQSRVARRDEIMQWYNQTGNWPELRPILNYGVISAKDKASYAVSVSVCEFLLTRGDKPQLLEFAASGAHLGWDRALVTAYNIQDVQQLQRLWQAWAASRLCSEAGLVDAT